MGAAALLFAGCSGAPGPTMTVTVVATPTSTPSIAAQMPELRHERAVKDVRNLLDAIPPPSVQGGDPAFCDWYRAEPSDVISTMTDGFYREYQRVVPADKQRSAWTKAVFREAVKGWVAHKCR